MDGITITESAAQQIKRIMETNEKVRGLRIAIAGGGCSGFQYEFELPEEIEDDDHVFISNEVTVVVDSISLNYLAGTELDWKEEVMGARFVLNNPNAVGACGCGESIRF